MKTDIIPISDEKAMERALACLTAGGLVAFPTDTVYGLGALAFNAAAVESIYPAKDRSVEKSIPVLIGDHGDLIRVVRDAPVYALRLAARFWPGPLTLVLAKGRDIPEAVSTSGTVGVRLPNHSAARELLRRAGPMAVTSANISGQLSPMTAEEVFRQLNGRIPLILDGGKTPGGVPSTVVDCTLKEARILREGPVTYEQIVKLFD
jgi:L-threonylcarbamoyladenylate synthase